MKATGLSLFLVGSCAAFSTNIISNNDVELIQSFTLFDNQNQILGRCDEVRPLIKTAEEDEEDEVEMFYATTKRYFMFPTQQGGSDEEHGSSDDGNDNDVLQIRQTSFGCGRLGATVWPSSIALASLLAGSNYRSSIRGKRILELGSGCGLPSKTAKQVCCAEKVLPTDYWEREGLDIGNRLVPKDLFGVNLAYNVGCEPRNLDWHDELSVFDVSTNFDPDIVVGSDLVYYPDDTEPLISTLDILLKNGSGLEDMLLILPLPPTSEREALPEFRKKIENGVLGNGEKPAQLDELQMVIRSASTNEEESHNLLRIRI